MTGMQAETQSDIVTKHCSHSVQQTVGHFTNLLGQKGLKVFAVIDQAAEARQAGLELRDTTVVLFGNPASGTPVMDAAALSALDLPLKVVIWDDGGQAAVSYYSPTSIARRHHLEPALASNLSGIDGLTDALTSA
jgi:uncharacterized protein (DUF302 family)